MDGFVVQAWSLAELKPDTLPKPVIVAADKGCALAPSCLRCPFDRCVEDMEPWERRRFVRGRLGGAGDDRGAV